MSHVHGNAHYALPKSKPKYEFKVMPFGLTNAPATFQAMMNEIFRDYLYKWLVIYLDDLVVFSPDWQTHLSHLRTLFRLFRQHQLFASPSKCQFGVEEFTFCGHKVALDQTRPLEDKLEAIRRWPVPTTAHQVRQFMGLASFYRRYIRDFARITSPLTDLLKEADAAKRRAKHRPITWNAQCAEAFQLLKAALTQEPVLRLPDSAKPFLVETDASEWAIGYVLYQLDATDRYHPVAYDGRKLQAAELRYPVHEKELLAIKEALRKWRNYLDNGLEITILTDHQSLQYLKSLRNPTKRVVRWIDEFQQYNLNIKYRKGSEAVVPDALSRRPDFIPDQAANVDHEYQRPAFLEQLNAVNAIRGVPEDKFFAALRTLKRTGQYPEGDDRLKRQLQARQGEFEVDQDDQVWHVDPLTSTKAPYLSPELRWDCLEWAHNNYGHFGDPGLQGVLSTRGWWPTMAKDTRNYVEHCPQCQLHQRRRNTQREPTYYQLKRLSPFERWAIDVVGPFPPSVDGNVFIVTAIDYATGWPVAKAIPNQEALTIAKFIHEDIYALYGPPKELLSDNGSNFLSEVIAHLVRVLQTRHRLTTPYHPRANGKVENLNGTLGAVLTKFTLGKNVHTWDLYLPEALYATRIRQHATSGRSPFFLVYGLEPRLLEDGQDLRPHNIEIEGHEARHQEAASARLLAYERLVQKAELAGLMNPEKFKGDNTSFPLNSWVLVRNENPMKLSPKWIGPFKVIKKHWLGTYALETPQGRVLRHLIHGDRLVRARCTDPRQFWAREKELTDTISSDPDTLKEILEEVRAPKLSYSRLASLSKKQWELLNRQATQHRGRAGAQRFLVREDTDGYDPSRRRDQESPWHR